MRFQDTKFWKNYSQFEKIVMNCSSRCTTDAVIFWRLFNYFQLNRAVEIGVYQGLTSALILESNPNSTLLGIDPNDRLDTFRKIYPELLDRFTLLKSRSQDVILDDQKFDFVLLDNEWNHQSIVRDVKQFLPHLNQSGILAFSYVNLPNGKDSINSLHGLETGWIPFLRSEQTEFWHHKSCDRSDFLDSLLTDPISKCIFIDNQHDEFGNTLCVAKTISMFTDHPEYFDLALKHYNI